MNIPSINITSNSHALVALTFGSPWLLAWAIGLAIPVLIHLWNRNRYQEIDWAAMRFLMQAVKQNSKRITLEQLILLTVRALILVLLSIAIANPLLKTTRDDLPVSIETRTLHILVIDASYSMGLRTSGKTLWENAIEAAIAKIHSASAGNAFTLIKMSVPSEVVVQDPSFDRDTMKQEVSGLRLTSAGADLESSLRSIDAMLSSVERGKSEFDRHEVTFFSDLGENSWNAIGKPDVRELIDSISRRATMKAQPIISNNRNNIAVTALTNPGGLLLPGDVGAISATLKNFGSQNTGQIYVDLFLDGASSQRKSLNIAAGQQAKVNFTPGFEFPGDHRIEIRATPDALSIDDRRYMVLPVRNFVRVLCVGGRPGETDNLSWALQPDVDKVNGKRSRIEATTISFAAISETRLQDFDCVIICNAAGFRSAEANQIHQYVVDGGGLVLFLGDSVQADSYNRQLLENSDPPLLPARILAKSEFADQRLNPLGYDHPIVDPFRGVRQTGLLTTPVWKYFRLENSIENGSDQEGVANRSRVALAFANGDPLIMTRDAGYGRVVLFASSASGKSIAETADGPQPWSEFHTWPSYVSLVHEMVQFAIGGSAQRQNNLVGDFLSGQISRSLFSRKVTMSGPNDGSIDVSIQANQPRGSNVGSAMSRWSAGPMELPGFYRLEGADSPNRPAIGLDIPNTGARSEMIQNETRFAVNVDTSESDLARLSVDDLPIQFQSQSGTDQPASLPAVDSSPSLFQYVLASLILLLIVESFLAWLFGRQSGIRNDNSRTSTGRAN